MDYNVLIKASLITEADVKTGKVEDIVSANLATIQAKAAKVDGLEAKVVKLEASLAKGAEVTVNRLIEAAVTAGGIPAKDKDSEETWRGLLTTAHGDDEQFTKVSALLAALKPAGDDLTKQIVDIKAGEVKTGDKDARQKSALVKAKQSLPSASFNDQWELAKSEDPTAFED